MAIKTVFLSMTPPPQQCTSSMQTMSSSSGQDHSITVRGWFQGLMCVCVW